MKPLLTHTISEERNDGKIILDKIWVNKEIHIDILPGLKKDNCIRGHELRRYLGW